jgi:hypothetical protein
MLSQKVFGIDRYFMWVDPQTKLRARINTDTFELLSQRESGLWENEGKIKLDPRILNHLPQHFGNKFFSIENGKKIRFYVNGTGQVYDYDPSKKELIRLDQTFHSGYNFTSNQFIRNGILYSIGGEGFWNYNSSITYFDEKLREWEIVRPKNKAPFPITTGYQGYNRTLEVYYSGGSKQRNYLKDEEIVFKDDLYQFDFKKNEWSFLGKLNSDLPYEKTEQVFWTGDLFLHFANGDIYIIDPIKNKVYLYQDNKKDLTWGYNPFVVQDTFITFKGQNEGPIQKLSISEIQKNATYIGEFYTSGIPWKWYSIGLFLIIFIMTVLKWRRKETIDSKELMFTQLERKFLNKLLGLKPNEYLNTYEINDILEASDKTQENQRKIRFNVIGQINKKLKAKYNWENAIDRKPLPEDKRLTIYKLDPVVMNELKRIMR